MSFALYFLIIALAIVLNDATPGTKIQGQCRHQQPFSIDISSQCPETRDRIPLEINRAVHIEASKVSPKPVRHGPWTHVPQCTDVLSSIGSKLCVYTNSSFSNGRGISIFTTPILAEEFANLPVFKDSSALKDVNVDSGAWYTQELPGKGMGMLAKTCLKYKDRVTAYTPALIAHLEGELDTMEREKWYRPAISQLPDPTRDAYLQLAFVYGQESIRVQDIVKANTFQLHVGGQNHLAVFPETSRLNHACSPNAQYFLDPGLLTHFVHATRPIAPDEEITISYTSPLDPTEVRQQHLQDGFHFACTCSRCTNQEATDETVEKIGRLQATLNDWSENSHASPRMAEAVLNIYRKEGLEGFMDIPYGFAALAYNAIGDAKKAVKYARLAQESILMKDGPWTPNMQIWNELLKDPQKHWSYKRRV